MSVNALPESGWPLRAHGVGPPSGSVVVATALASSLAAQNEAAGQAIESIAAVNTTPDPAKASTVPRSDQGPPEARDPEAKAPPARSTAMQRLGSGQAMSVRSAGGAALIGALDQAPVPPVGAVVVATLPPAPVAAQSALVGQATSPRPPSTGAPAADQPAEPPAGSV